MRIFYSPSSDPMLLGPGTELNALYAHLSEFLASPAVAIALPAQITGSPEPYQQFLPGLRLKKTQDIICLSLAKDHWLELSGSAAYLSKYVSHFRFERPDSDGHHHPDHATHMSPGSLRLIIEADSSWGASNEG